MRQMTEATNTSGSAGLRGDGGALSAALRRATEWFPAALFACMALLNGADLLADGLREGTPSHLALEGAEVVASLAGFAFVWRRLRSAEARADLLARDLDGTRADLARWRAEAQEVLRGLGAAIERQFERWQLTPAEADVALQLLKGLSLKEVAQLRSTSERTVRQQALTVYRKAGLAGRAELAAFFLEDLLLPPERGGAQPCKESRGGVVPSRNG